MYETDFDIEMSSPAIVDGKLYIGSDDHNLYCLDADRGDKIWNYSLVSTVFSSPCIAGGRVYIGGETDDDLYCLDAVTGSVLWSFSSPDIHAFTSSCAYDDGKIYVASVGAYLQS